MKTFIKAVYSILVLVLLGPAALTAAPAYLYYQGRIVNAAGNPYTLPQTMHFKIYNVPSGVNPPLWSEDQVVTPDNGIFSVSLGSVIPLPASTFASDTLYLGITVDPDPAEMTPRTRLLSVPYAITAGNLGSPASVVTVSTHSS